MDPEGSFVYKMPHLHVNTFFVDLNNFGLTTLKNSFAVNKYIYNGKSNLSKF